MIEAGVAIIAYGIVAWGVWYGLEGRGDRKVAGLIAVVWPLFVLAQIGYWIGEGVR